MIVAPALRMMAGHDVQRDRTPAQHSLGWRKSRVRSVEATPETFAPACPSIRLDAPRFYSEQGKFPCDNVAADTDFFCDI